MTKKIYHLAPNGSSNSSAAWRILRAQQLNGIEAQQLVFKYPKLDGVFPYTSSRISSLIYFMVSKTNSILVRLLYKNRNSLPWSLNTIKPPGFSPKILSQMSLLNIHWLPSTFRRMKSEARDVPIILTSHDVWNLTGGCHCNLGCEGWKKGCTNCPQVTSRVPFLQTPAKSFKTKAQLYKSISKLGIVAPSRWIADMFTQSPMFENRQIEIIPNPGNTSIYRITDDYLSLLRIETRRQTYRVLYVVSGNLSAYHKGFDLLIEMLKILGSGIETDFEIIIVGDARNEQMEINGISITYYGEVHNEEEMSSLMNVANLVISTSRQDNLPNSLIESILCGTPVLAFNIGGISEIVINEYNGILIEPFDLISFSNAFKGLIEGTTKLEHTREKIASSARELYSESAIASKYAKFYETMKDEMQ